MNSPLSLAEAMDVLEVSPRQLGKLSGICIGTIHVLLAGRPDGYSTQHEVAASIAAALGLKVEEIAWPNGLSHLGRPAHTGHKIASVTRQGRCCSRCGMYVALALDACESCGHPVTLS